MGLSLPFLAPAGRCCCRLLSCSCSWIRGNLCGGSWDLGSSDAAGLRLAALGRGGGGTPATRPAGEVVEGGSSVGPASTPQPGGVRRAKVSSEEVCLDLLEPVKGEVLPAYEEKNRGLGNMEYGSAWRENGRVWVTLRVGGYEPGMSCPRCGHVADRHARLRHTQPRS